MTNRRPFAAIVLTLSATPAMAADSVEGSDPSGLQNQYVMSIGIGGQMKPRYPGSDDYILSPYPIIDIDRFYMPGLGQVVDGNADRSGLGFYPSFSFAGERDPSDADALKGTDRIDWAFEAGMGMRYEEAGWRALAEIRQGFNGHDGQVATAGFDLIADDDTGTRFEIGPRVNWASQDYMETYFGVTAREAARLGSVLSAFDPDGGIYSAGIKAKASHDLTDRVTLHARAGWERLIGDAADSPIVEEGSRDQFTVGAGLSYRFGFDLFN